MPGELKSGPKRVHPNALGILHRQRYRHAPPRRVAADRLAPRPASARARQLQRQSAVAHLVARVVSAGDQAVFVEVLPRFDRVTAVTAETARVTAERHFFHGQLIVELPVGGHAETVGERRARGYRL